MPSFDFDAHENNWLHWSPYWKVAGVYVIKGTMPGWFGREYAYVGLSRNIAKRLESHRADAADGSHVNGDLQRLIQKAGPTLSFSVIWVCRRDWNRGGNYECTLAERHAIAHYTAQTGVPLLNRSPGGELGELGIKATPVVAIHADGTRRYFRSITACASYLDTSSERVKSAALNHKRLRGHSIQITDSDFAIRQQIKEAWKDPSHSDDISIDWGQLWRNPWFILTLAFLLMLIKMC
ncbi:MAG: hypothetical protein O2818_03840 [Bacteroidetes bacterium]|nr:hypothetical protein [Bacteroidota bacterium]MDA1336000.1 hypothetical protein [Bacteroidota bacterium]